MSPRFSVQWHLTNKCEFRCKHCYINEKDRKDFLKLEDMISIFYKFKQFIKHYNIEGHLVLSGGNPLLYDGFWDLIEIITENQIPFSILGNPTISDMDIERLVNMGCTSYQVSLEGLKEVNDSIRGNGSWDMTISFLRRLRPLERHVMLTLSESNWSEVVPLMDYLAENNLCEVFSFARYIPINRSEMLNIISTNHYRETLFSAFYEYNKLKYNGYSLRLFFKESELWPLVFNDLNIKIPNLNNDIISGGCYIGNIGLALLPNGDIMLCRRLPIIVGNILKDDFNIFFESEKINKWRFYNINACRECPLHSECRGCIAMKYLLNRNIENPDPNCWKSSN